ncbi:MAG: sterol desaturase family protein [Actinomycetota bacterium]
MAAGPTRPASDPRRSTRRAASLIRSLAADGLWWIAYLVFCFVAGIDVGAQLRSPLFWLIAAALEAWTIVRWFRTRPDVLERRSAVLGHGHHRHVVRRDVVRRVLLCFVAVAAVGLTISAFSVDTSIAEGRTNLLGDDLAGAGHEAWSESIAALDAELWGLAIYDLALVVGAVVIAVELVALFSRPRRPGQVSRSLWIRDSLASLSTLIPFYVIEIFTVTAMIGAYFFLWDNVTPSQLPIEWWTVALGILSADLAYYWEHRTGHEIRLFWTGHAVHHSSPIFNTAVAFRFGPFEPVLAVLFHLPLIILGFHPAIVILGELTVQAYQFWIHTETIGRLGPLDRFLNTPSNHRVHHGADDKYLDKNYGGILIVFDRMFGTYQAEEETPTYGLTTQIDTTNPLRVWTSEFPALFADLRSSSSWSDWWSYLTRGPGWSPSDDQPVATPDPA